jgi:hypothetical protein
MGRLKTTRPRASCHAKHWGAIQALFRDITVQAIDFGQLLHCDAA